MEIGKLTQAYSPVPSVSPQIISTSFLKPFKFLTRRTSSVRRALSHDFSGVKMSAVKLEPSLLVKQKASELANVLKGASVFLVGMNCSLKTELGTRLADALRYYYFDSDDLVEQAAGGKGAAISLRETDEKGFRDSETEVLKQLSSMGRLVVCAGDGAVQSSTNLALMRHGISIWVDVPLDFLANEVVKANATSDSVSYEEVLERLSVQYYERKEGYKTSDSTVSLQKLAAELGLDDVASIAPEDMVLEALKEIERLTRVMKMLEAAARPF